MQFVGGSNCLMEDLHAECIKLKKSNASFQAYPQEKKIRLALSSPSQLQVPLNLALQHGECNISCEGRTRNKCETFVDDFYWQNVSSSFYFDGSMVNLTSLHQYCVTATIGRCCHVFTRTVLLEDYDHNNFTADNPKETFSASVAAAIVIIIIAISLATFVILYYMKACHNSNHRRPTQTHVSLIQQDSVHFDNESTNITVICMYIMDRTQPFQDEVQDLQSFLRFRGLSAIDIYDEEECIKSSFSQWVQRVLENKTTKILLIDSEQIRPLWNGSLNGCRELQSVQQAITYIGSCIPVSDLFNRLFIIRLKTMRPIQEEFIYPGSVRVYVFPTQRERLWKDLMKSTSNVALQMAEEE
uniref:SEFIR domain-containing protein n=1 Tax=Cuerna arida TaxID=1464854 RepID=A0A1B6GHP0_9HEMI